MFEGIRHKGLRLLFENGNRRKVPPEHVDKIERILARLDVSTDAADMNLPGFRLHRLRGDLAGFWSVRVSANWRIVFAFNDGAARDVDLIDYH